MPDFTKDPEFLALSESDRRYVMKELGMSDTDIDAAMGKRPNYIPGDWRTIMARNIAKQDPATTLGSMTEVGLKTTGPMIGGSLGGPVGAAGGAIAADLALTGLRHVSPDMFGSPEIRKSEIPIDVAGAVLPYGVTRGLTAVGKTWANTKASSILAKQADRMRETLERHDIPYTPGAVGRRVWQMLENWSRGALISWKGAEKWAEHDIRLVRAMNKWRLQLLDDIGPAVESPMIAKAVTEAIADGKNRWGDIIQAIYKGADEVTQSYPNPAKVRALGEELIRNLRHEQAVVGKSNVPSEHLQRYENLLESIANFGRKKLTIQERGVATVKTARIPEETIRLDMLNPPPGSIDLSEAGIRGLREAPGRMITQYESPYEAGIGILKAEHIPYSDFQLLRQSIGAKVGEFRGTPFEHQARRTVNRLYAITSEAMEDAANAINPSLAADIKVANKMTERVHDLFERASIVAKIRSARPEDMENYIEQLFQFGKQSPSQWSDLKNAMGAAQWIQVKPILARKIMDDYAKRLTSVTPESDLRFRGTQLIKELADPETAIRLREFMTPEQINALKEFAASSLSPGIINPMSGRLTYGTEQVQSAARVAQIVVGGLALGTAPATSGASLAPAAAILIAPEVLARMLTNPGVAKFLAKGFEITPEMAQRSGWLVRAMNIARIYMQAPGTYKTDLSQEPTPFQSVSYNYDPSTRQLIPR